MSTDSRLGSVGASRSRSATSSGTASRLSRVTAGLIFRSMREGREPCLAGEPQQKTSVGAQQGVAAGEHDARHAQGAHLAHDGGGAPRIHFLGTPGRGRAGRTRLLAARGHLEIERRDGGHWKDLPGMAATLRYEVVAAAKAVETDPTPSIGPSPGAGELGT